MSIPALVERLGLTETAVRRHVDALHAEGLVEPREADRPAPPRAPRQGLGAHRARPPRPRQRLRPPRRRRAALPRRHRRRATPCSSSPSSASPSLEAALRRPHGRRGRRHRRPRRSPRRRAQRRRLRGVRPPRRRCRRRPAHRHPAVPGPLPGAARRRRVPRSSARPRPRRSPACSASTSSAWPPWPTATTSAPPSSPHRPPRGPRHDEPHRRAQPRSEGPRHLRVRLGRQRHRRRDRAPWAQRRGRQRHLGAQERAAVDARPAAEVAAPVRQEADADLGLRPVRHRLPEHQVLREVHREAGHLAGRTCPRTSRTPTTGSASPRPRSSASSPVSPRSTSRRSSTTRSARTWRRRASSSSTPTPGCASTRTSSASTSPR